MSNGVESIGMYTELWIKMEGDGLSYGLKYGLGEIISGLSYVLKWTELGLNYRLGWNEVVN